MSDKTLFLIQTQFTDTLATLDKVKALHSAKDQLILMGEAVLCINHADLTTFPSVAILASDAEMLAETGPDHVQVLDDAQFADCILQFTRCISLK